MVNVKISVALFWEMVFSSNRQHDAGAINNQITHTMNATQTLAEINANGPSCEAEEKAASALNRCWAESRAWNWEAANKAMRAAYRALGATAPKVAINAIHGGNHPVQIAEAQLA